MKTRSLVSVSILCWLVATGGPAFAFQVADGTPPSPVASGKYIFYWGKHQCDLIDANGYQGRIVLSPTAFRQMILSAPKLWNGQKLITDVHFKLEETTVSTTDYLTQIAQLDARLGPKATPGAVLYIKELALSEGATGSIFLVLEENKEKTTLMFGNAPSQLKAYLNDYFLDRVVWGREDIYETSDRDFFTVGEFWQTIRQEPAVDWKSYQQAQQLRSMITFTSKDKASFSVVTVMEEGAYPGLLDNLENYRYLVHPGAIVTLELQTMQYEMLFKKVLNIVSDDDQRLRLRRHRDQHLLSLEWGVWMEKIPGLYLTAFTNPQGETILIDAPIAQNMAISMEDDKWATWAKTKPVCTIDGEPISGDLSFRVTTSDSSVFYVHSNHFEPDSLPMLFPQNGGLTDRLQIDSFAVEGFVLPPMAFRIFLRRIYEGVLVRNELTALQMASANASQAKLFPPTLHATDIEFRLDLPERSTASLSVFEPDGWNPFVRNDTFPAGTSTVRIPRSEFRNKGTHFAFLNTTFGVVKVAFEVD